MKRRHQLVSVIAAAFMIAALTGCNGFFNPKVDFDNEIMDTSINYTGTSILTGVIENYDDVMRAANGKPTSTDANGARLILPQIDGGGYDFYLFGTKGVMTCGPYLLDSDSFNGKTSGEFQYRLPQGAWNLVLYALEPGATAPTAAECTLGLAGTALLLGKSYIDLSQGQSTAKFVLSPEGLTTKGTVKLTIKLDGWSLQELLKPADAEAGTPAGARANMTISAELRDLKTNQAVSNTTASLTSLFKTADEAIYDISATKFDPGTYNFVVSFKDATAGKKAEWEWSDKLMIFPGKTTDEDVYISQIIQYEPKAPAALLASYTGTQNTPKTDQEHINYQVKFDWSGKYVDGTALTPITNETYFELQVANISGVAGKSIGTFNLGSTDALSATNPIKWSDDTIEYIGLKDTDNTKTAIADTSVVKTGTIKTYNSESQTDTDYVDGSLYANNESITLWLKLGEEYTARIRAVNKTGHSDWTYVSLDDVTPVTGTTISPTGIKYLESTINEYYIKYWLNGGDKSPAQYGVGYKIDFGPANVAKDGDEASDSIGLRYWNAPGEQIKYNDILLSGWKLNSWEASLYPVSKADEITYSTVDDLPDGLLKTAGYVKTVTRTTTTYLPDGTSKVETKQFVSSKASPTAPTNGTKEPGSDWVHVKNCAANVAAGTATPLLIYDGYKNIDLWATYDTTFGWKFMTTYKLEKSYITYQLGSYDGTTFTPAGNYTTPKALDGTNAPTATVAPDGTNYYIKWNIKIPAGTETWVFNSYTITVTPTDANPYVIDRVRTTDVKARDTATEIITNMAACIQGVYKVNIDAGIPGTQYSDTVPITLYIQ